MSEQINTDTEPVVKEVCEKTHYPAWVVEGAARVLYIRGFTIRKTIDAILECAASDAIVGGGTTALDAYTDAQRPQSMPEERKQYVKPTTSADFKQVPGLNRKQRRDAKHRRGAWA